MCVGVCGAQSQFVFVKFRISVSPIMARLYIICMLSGLELLGFKFNLNIFHSFDDHLNFD